MWRALRRLVVVSGSRHSGKHVFHVLIKLFSCREESNINIVARFILIFFSKSENKQKQIKKENGKERKLKKIRESGGGGRQLGVAEL